MYFVLAAVGLFTLLVGASVRLRRPRDQATLHFFWLCVAFFGVFTFSFNGPLDRLDWVFYWGDAVAHGAAAAAAAALHAVFPERPRGARRRGVGARLPLMYLPALALGGRACRGRRRRLGRTAGRCSRASLDLLDRAEPVYLFVCASRRLVACWCARSSEITSLTGRRQLRWIAWGTALGVGPFAFGYALPWALGVDPPLALQLTAIPLGLVPLTFASAIVRYRLRDVEVIIKRGAGLHRVPRRQRRALPRDAASWSASCSPNDADPHNWIVALLATTVVVLLAQPVQGGGAERARPRVLPRPLRLPPRAGRRSRAI